MFKKNQKSFALSLKNYIFHTVSREEVPTEEISTEEDIFVKYISEIDFLSKDKKYWKNLFNSIDSDERLSNKSSIALISKIKNQRHNFRCKKKTWEEVLPKEVVNWAWNKFKDYPEYSNCSDNFRVARCNNSSQKRRYYKQYSEGCCGFCDFSAWGPDGYCYMLGFNYGH